VVVDPDEPKLYWPNGQTTYPETDDPKLVKDGVLLSAGAPADGIHLLTRDGVARRVVATSPGNITTMFDVDHGAGDTIVWLEAKEDETGEFHDFSLWASPYATSESGVVRRRIPQASEHLATSFLVANAEMVAMTTTNQQQARLIRQSDGAAWAVPADPDMYFVAPLWVDEHAVWYLTQTNLKAFRASNGLIRVDRSSLGAPTMPDGS
jgi:hypothetical protein